MTKRGRIKSAIILSFIHAFSHAFSHAVVLLEMIRIAFKIATVSTDEVVVCVEIYYASAP